MLAGFHPPLRFLSRRQLRSVYALTRTRPSYRRPAMPLSDDEADAEVARMKARQARRAYHRPQIDRYREDLVTLRRRGADFRSLSDWLGRRPVPVAATPLAVGPLVRPRVSGPRKAEDDQENDSRNRRGKDMPTFNPRRQAEEIVRPRLRMSHQKPPSKEEHRGMIYSTTTRRRTPPPRQDGPVGEGKLPLLPVTDHASHRPAVPGRTRPASHAQNPQPGPALPRDAAQDRAGRPGAAEIHRPVGTGARA